MPRKSLRQRVFNLHKFGPVPIVICCHCKKLLPYERMTVEHLRPRALGGTNHLSNLMPSCAPCNNQRPCEDVTQKFVGQLVVAAWIERVAPSYPRKSGSKRKRRAAGKRIAPKKKKPKAAKIWHIQNP